MLDYDIIDRKATMSMPSDYEDTDKVECIDLLSNSFRAQPNMALSPIVVNDNYIARPDLVSLALYGTDRYADIICKVNGISNPFELNEGQILLVPDIDGIQYYIQNGMPSELAPNTSSLSALKSTVQKQKTEIRTANEQIIGDSNYVIDKSSNLIFY